MSTDRAWNVPPTVIAAGAVFCGVLMDASVKHINGFVDLYSLVFWRFLIGAVLVGVLYFASGRRLPGWSATRLHALRGLVHLIASSCFFFSLSKLELATVTVMGFTSVLWITPVAWLVLSERPSMLAGLAALVGFAGVVVSFVGAEFFDGLTADDWIGLVAVISAALFYAVSLVLLRVRAAKDGAFLVAFYANLFPALYMIGPALVMGQGVVMSDMPYLIFLGVLGTLIWLLMSLAFARAPAQRLAPMEYTALLWSAIIGWLVFRELPSGLFWLGAAIIVLACAIVSFSGPGVRRYGVRFLKVFRRSDRDA